jgi:hypothetical protein
MGESSSGKNRQGFREQRCQTTAQGFSSLTKTDGRRTKSTLGEDQGSEKVVIKESRIKKQNGEGYVESAGVPV